jgi:hypothetical protein
VTYCGPQPDPWRHDVEREEALEALGRPQAEQEADPGAAPVVPGQLDPLQPELVEDGEYVGRQVPWKSSPRARTVRWLTPSTWGSSATATG